MGDQGSIVDGPRSALAPGSPLLGDWPLLIFLAALPVGIVARIWPGLGLPLWMDETFTGTIASQPDFAGLLRWCLSELTGPAFYMPMWLWAKAAGISDIALRVPPLLFSIATPVMIARYGHPDRNVRLFWAIFTLLWLPVMPVAAEARPYPQLLFLGAAQAILFLRLARRVGPGLAFWWGTVTALAVLTHSYALVIGGLQGLALLIGHRRFVLRFYPAILPLGLMFVWMAYHLPFIIGFMSGHVAHYEPISPAMLFGIPRMIFGDGLGGFILFGLIFLTREHWRKKVKLASPEAQLIWTAIGAALVIIVAGLIAATMMPRYLTPAIPALLFGFACWVSRVRLRDSISVHLAIVVLFAAMLFNLVAGPVEFRFRERRYFQFETASAWLMERSPTRLHFLWSTPTGTQSSAGNLGEVAGFFLHRDGRPVRVIVERGGPDPNLALATVAGTNPHSAILWMADDPLPAAMTPRIEAIDRRWECRDFGGEGKLVYACRRRPS